VRFRPQACNRRATSRLARASGRAGREQGVSGFPAGSFPIQMCAHPADLVLQDLDPLFKLDDPVEIEILSHGFRQSLTAHDPDFRWFFHPSLSLLLPAPA
jgi:hypothetical protein